MPVREIPKHLRPARAEIPMGDPPVPDPLATVEGVAAQLGVAVPDSDSALYARIQRCIDVAEREVRRYLRDPDLGQSGTSDITLIEPGSPIPVQVEGGTVTAVSVVYIEGEESTPLDDDLWYQDGRSVRITGSGVWPGLPADEQEPRPPHAVTLTVQRPAELDPIIPMATEIAAAALLTRGADAARGLKSESLGDYSYTLADTGAAPGSSPFFAEARSLLRPLRRAGVATT